MASPFFRVPGQATQHRMRLSVDGYICVADADGLLPHSGSPTGREGILAVFLIFSSLHKHTEKCDSPQDFEQVFRGAPEPLSLLQVHPVIAAVLRLRQLQRKQQGVSVVIAARHAGFCHAEALHYRLRAPVVGIGHGNYLPQFGHACA